MRLKMLGRLSLEDSPFARQDPLLLLTYLVTEGPTERTDLAALFFSSTSDPSDSLSSALQLLHKHLGHRLVREKKLVSTQLASDYHDFRHAFETGDFATCLKLYEGEFLEGVYPKQSPQSAVSGLEEWINLKRLELATLALKAALTLARPLIGGGTTNKLIELGTLAYDIFSRQSEHNPHFSREGFVSEDLLLLHGILLVTKSPRLPEFKATLSSLDLEVHSVDVRRVAKHNLPTLETHFFGREQQTETATRLLHDSPGKVLTIVGAGGVGKTSFALHFAHSQLQTGHFRDGVYLVKLEGLNFASLITTTIAKTLTLELSPTLDALEQVMNAIGTSQMLIIFDNLEHLKGREDIFENLLQLCPNLKIITTSREHLHTPTEIIVELAGLPIPPSHLGWVDGKNYPSLQLFEQVAQAHDKTFSWDERTYPQVRRLCHMVEGTPLAIRLLAGVAHLQPLGALTQQLALELDVIASNQTSVPERQRSLRSSLEYSWKLLTPKQQQTLSWLSVFRGGFDFLAAKQVTGATLLDMETLLHKSLLQKASEYRFDFHALLGQFAFEKLQKKPKDHQEAVQRHQDYFLSLTKEANAKLNGDEALNALSFFEREAANLEAIWQRSHEVDVLLDLARLLKPYQEKRGLMEEQLTLLHDMLPKAEKMQEHSSQAQLYNLLGEAYQLQEEQQHAWEWFEKSLKLQGEALTLTKAETLSGLGGVHYERREFSEAITYFERAQAIYKSLGNQPKESDEINNVAAIHFQLGDYQQASALWQQALSLARRFKDRHLEAVFLSNIAEAHRARGELEEAVVHLERAKKLHERLGNTLDTLHTLTNLASVYFRRGEFDKALPIRQSLLETQRSLQDKAAIALTLNNLGMIHERLGSLSTAHSLLSEALDLQESMDERTNRAATLCNLSTVVLQQDNVERAHVYANQALQLARETNAPTLEAIALNFMGDVIKQQGRFAEAKEHYLQARDIQLDRADLANLASTYTNLALLSSQLKELDLARSWANKALAIASKSGLRPELRLAKYVLSQVHYELGEFSESQKMMREVIELGIVMKHPQLHQDQAFFRSLAVSRDKDLGKRRRSYEQKN